MKEATNIKVIFYLNANRENLKNILFFFFFVIQDNSKIESVMGRGYTSSQTVMSMKANSGRPSFMGRAN